MLVTLEMALLRMKAISLLILSIAFASIVRVEAAENAVLRFGHFPNITHVQALVAHNFSRQGKGWFEEIGLLTDKILFAPIERFLHRRWGTGLR